MTDRARLEQALIAADRAGDTEAAKKLAQALRAVPAKPQKQPQAPAEQPATEPATGKPVGSAESLVREPLLVAGTSALAAPVAGIAGIGTAGARALGLTDAEPADVVGRVQSALTYEPRTQAGDAGTAALSYPFEKLAQGADWAGQQVADSARAYVGPNAANVYGTATNVGIQSAPALLGRRGGKVSRDVTSSPDPGRVAAPSREAQPAAAAPEAAERPAGLGELPEVAPDLVLELEAKKVAPPVSATAEKIAEARARKFTEEKLGIDWKSLSAASQLTLSRVAGDARKLSKLDPDAVRRQIQLESLPVPVPATRGQLTRDPVQLRNEGNVSATNAGAPIRDVYLNQNEALLSNLEVLKGRVANRKNPAQTPEAVGLSVQDQALRAKLELKKKEVAAKYKAAEAAGELQGMVSPARLIQAVRNAPDKTHFGWVESWMKDMDVIKKTDSGTVTSKLTLKQLEDLRQAAVARAMNGGTEGFYAGKVIKAIDDSTDGAGGKLYKEARKARREQALEFEETGAVARLVENKSKTDRATALEDTWRKTVVGGSIQDLRNVKRSLLTGGDRSTRSAGKRAWRDIKAQTIQHIQNEATKGVAMNERGQPNVTPAAMKRAIDSIGKDKLNEIFGEGTAVRLDRILEATRTVKTVPPAGHAGSSTMSNVLAFLERGLNRVPVIGDVGAGAIKAGVKLNEMGQSGRVIRESRQMPLTPAPKRNALQEY